MSTANITIALGIIILIFTVLIFVYIYFKTVKPKSNKDALLEKKINESIDKWITLDIGSLEEEEHYKQFCLMVDEYEEKYN